MSSILNKNIFHIKDEVGYLLTFWGKKLVIYIRLCATDDKDKSPLQYICDKQIDLFTHFQSARCSETVDSTLCGKMLFLLEAARGYGMVRKKCEDCDRESRQKRPLYWNIQTAVIVMDIFYTARI